ncbi:MAG TPA: RNA polymerase sigma factor [Longimicrobiales bacterium]|nr:RNA polymerase sigma factor [Longimicrobiales bacterium]
MADSAETNQALIARAADGDEDAFRVLVGRVHGHVRRWAAGLVATPQDAEEVTQDVLVRLYRNLAGFRGESRLTTWLYRVTRNAAADHRRAARRHGSEQSLEAVAGGVAETGEEPLRRIHAEGLSSLVAAAYRTLPDRQREVLDLVDFQGFAPTEVADMLALKPVSVRASLFKARRTIRESILEQHPELTEGYST